MSSPVLVFVLTIVLSGEQTGLIARPSTRGSAPAMTANTFLETFPSREQLPEARWVIKIRYDNAQHCLVHIRDFHGVPGMSAKTEKVVRDVQDDIRAILTFLINDSAIRLRAVYKEGITAEEEGLVNVFWRNSWPSASVLQGSSLGTDGEPLRTRVTTWAWMILSGDESAKIHELSAVRRLCYETGLRVRAAETRSSDQAASVALTDTTTIGRAIARRCVLEDRENLLLQRIAEAGETLAVTVYGGGHDWANNVKAWNRTHPEQKFSLIEVTPDAYYWYVIRAQRPPGKRVGQH